MPHNFRSLEEIDAAIARATEDRIEDALSLLHDLKNRQDLRDALARAWQPTTPQKG